MLRLGKWLRVSKWLCLLVLSVSVVQADVEKTLPENLDDPIIGSEKGALHVVTSTECFKSYFVYQAYALKYTFDKVQQPGKITRMISCDPEDAKKLLSEEDLSIMDTLVVPNWTRHPVTGDYYQPYNKPVSLMFWLAQRKPTAEWTLIVDPDMMFRQPFLVEQFNIPEGFAISSHYNYLKGGHNELAERHIPEVPQREDMYGGPAGRRADETGTFLLLRTRDLVKIAPLWLKYTEIVREDPNAWNLTGDPNLKEGQKAWISEMYGYIFAAAKVGVHHKVDVTAQYYPGYAVKDFPLLIHYGLVHTVGDYSFSKHKHFDFDPLHCPPWNTSTSRPKEQDVGLFPHPPFPSSISEWEPRKRYSLLLVIEFGNAINKALCIRHRQKCSDLEEAVEKDCKRVDKIESALEEAYKILHLPGVICHDDNEHCAYWRDRGECEKNWLYMSDNCRASCQLCRTFIPRAPVQQVGNAPVILPQTDTKYDNLTTVDKQDCLQLGLNYIVEDPNCRQLVRNGSIQLEDLEKHEFRIGDTSSASASLGFPQYITINILIAITCCLVFRTVSQGRKRKRNKRSTLQN